MAVDSVKDSHLSKKQKTSFLMGMMPCYCFLTLNTAPGHANLFKEKTG